MMVIKVSYNSIRVERNTASVDVTHTTPNAFDKDLNRNSLNTILISNSDGRTPAYDSEEVEIKITDEYLLELKNKIDQVVKEKDLKEGDSNQ